MIQSCVFIMYLYVLLPLLHLVFFKQKTAYEMRISDWSSDVCSSDLSSVVSHTDPHHTPWAPSAMAAATWRPLPIPPAASTGVGATASTTSGTRDRKSVV